MKHDIRHHAGHMEHKTSGMKAEHRTNKVERDVPRIKAETNIRANPGAEGGQDAGNAALKVPMAGPPKPGRGNEEGRP